MMKSNVLVKGKRQLKMEGDDEYKQQCSKVTLEDK